MGLIIGSSNIFGLIFDFLLAKYITNTNYRRLFLIVYGLCFIYPLLLWSAKTLPLFMIAMSVWGLYGDLNNFATFDFVSRRSKFVDHSKTFGVIGVFRSLGYLIAPLIAGVIVVKTITFFPFSLALSFIIVTFIFYLILVQISPKKDSLEFDHTQKYRKYNFIREFYLLKNIAKILSPVLFFSVLLCIFDAVFWTIGPIFSKAFTNFSDFGGLFMTAYTLPVLFVSWFIKPITAHFGKKRTALIAFFLGNLFLLPITFISNPAPILIFIFLSSLISSVAWPSLEGAYADYITESNAYQKEIESLNDVTANIGYIIGPIFGGFMADFVGIKHVFLPLVLVNLFVVLILLKFTPKTITVRV
jgi:MFS family permease